MLTRARLILLSVLTIFMGDVAFGGVAIPKLTGPVVDLPGILSPSDKGAIESSIRALKEKSGVQFQVLVIESLEGVPIEDFSIRLAEAWKIGGRGDDKGLILILALKDRAWRIEVGQGLEGDIPDVKASRIGREVLVVGMRSGNAGRAIDSTLRALAETANLSYGDGEPRAEKWRDDGHVSPVGVIFGLLIFFFFVAMATLRSLGGRRRGPWWWGGGWGGGSGGWGSGSSGSFGGGWSGGGGGFSGGGASGRW
jgi:uncharacterized protein